MELQTIKSRQENLDVWLANHHNFGFWMFLESVRLPAVFSHHHNPASSSPASGSMRHGLCLDSSASLHVEWLGIPW